MSLTQQNIELWGDDIPWLVGLREKGLNAFKKLGFPKAKTEAWKYSYFNEWYDLVKIILLNEILGKRKVNSINDLKSLKYLRDSISL